MASGECKKTSYDDTVFMTPPFIATLSDRRHTPTVTIEEGSGDCRKRARTPKKETATGHRQEYEYDDHCPREAWLMKARKNQRLMYWPWSVSLRRPDYDRYKNKRPTKRHIVFQRPPTSDQKLNSGQLSNTATVSIKTENGKAKSGSHNSRRTPGKGHDGPSPRTYWPTIARGTGSKAKKNNGLWIGKSHMMCPNYEWMIDRFWKREIISIRPATASKLRVAIWWPTIRENERASLLQIKGHDITRMMTRRERHNVVAQERENDSQGNDNKYEQPLRLYYYHEWASMTRV